MSKISMDLIKELREKTQVSMADCKKALEEAKGSIEEAIEFLRKKGSAVAAKRANNETNHGRVEAFVNENSTEGALVEVCCETDFSGNTQDMRDFVVHSAQEATKHKLSCKDSLLAASTQVQDKLNELIAKIAEKIELKRVFYVSVDTHGVVNAYIHPGSTVGVIIAINADKELGNAHDAVKALAKDLCMQIAVNNPLGITSTDIDASVLAKEREIITDQLKDDKRPANILEKIVEGRMNKFYEEVCLLNQKFIKNDKVTINQHLTEVGKAHGLTLSVAAFRRFAVGR